MSTKGLPGHSCNALRSELRRHAGTRLPRSSPSRPQAIPGADKTLKSSSSSSISCHAFLPIDFEGQNQRFSLTVLCFSCDLQSWHEGAVRQPAAGHMGRECLFLGQKTPPQSGSSSKKEKEKKKRSFFKWTFIQSPTQRHQKDGNSFGFLLPATWDTQKGPSCCCRYAHRHEERP